MSIELSRTHEAPQVAPSAVPPAFRFAYPHPDLSRRRARITPWGYSGDGVDRLGPLWRGVVGEIDVVDARLAVARFARIDGERLLAGARQELQRWAINDRWELAFAEGIEPLRDPDPAPLRHPGDALCTSCDDRYRTGTVCHIGFATRGWEPTRCYSCGGRLRWWSVAEPGAKV